MSKSRTLRVALVAEKNQGGAEANLALIEQRVAEAAAQGAKLVLLQELHNGAYFCQHECVDEFDQAEPIPGPSTERLPRARACWRCTARSCCCIRPPSAGTPPTSRTRRTASATRGSSRTAATRWRTDFRC